MSNLFSDSRGFAYYVEDVVFHSIAFAFLGPPIAFFLFGCFGMMANLLASVGADAPSASSFLFSSFSGHFLFLAWVFVGPSMLAAGAIVSVVSRHVERETVLAGLGFCVAVFTWLVSALLLFWRQLGADGELIVIMAITGLVMTRVTRFIRRRRNQHPDTGNSAT